MTLIITEALTIGPVIAKVIESVIRKLCQDNLHTDDLQFGFKECLSCTNAVFVGLLLTISHIEAVMCMQHNEEWYLSVYWCYT